MGTALSPELDALGREHGWPVELIEGALANGVKERTLKHAMRAGLSGEKARQLVGVEPLPAGWATLHLDWMDTPNETGVRARPGPNGLTLEAINVGSYGVVPDRWMYDNDTPRGSVPANEDYVAGSYTIYDKADCWADCAGRLYEEGIQARWAPASAVDWNACRSTDPALERAMSQFATNLSELNYVLCQGIARWYEEISYGYHEVKAYIASQGFELMRHSEAFRKRAIWSGFGMGVQSPGNFNRELVGAMRFQGAVAQINVLAASFLATLYDHADVLAPTPEDAKLMRLCRADLERHMEFGVDHLRFHLDRKPEELPRVTLLFDIGESRWARDFSKDAEFKESLVMLLGKGDREVGLRELGAMRRQQVLDYQERLRQIGIDKTVRINPLFREWLEA
ncbi:MAG: hypothetical protein ACKVT1_05830 [Dehalococcoidia bacterium]